MAATKSLLNTIWERKFTFLFVYFIVFLFTYLFLVAIDFVPEPKTDATSEEDALVIEPVLAQVTEQEVPTAKVVEPVSIEPILPTKIYIKSLDKTIEVLNPTSRKIEDLDQALLYGVVRHPDSAHLGQEGNVFILGHSSYLPTVLNRNFKAFNGIQYLKWGDEIEVSSGNQVFVYRVEKVYEALASELYVPIAVEEKMLTIATCDSFGSVDDRYIVEARQIEVRDA